MQLPKKNTIFCNFKELIGWRVNRKTFLKELILCKIVIYMCYIWCFLRFTYCVKQCGCSCLEESWGVLRTTSSSRICKSLEFQVNLSSLHHYSNNLSLDCQTDMLQMKDSNKENQTIQLFYIIFIFCNKEWISWSSIIIRF